MGDTIAGRFELLEPIAKGGSGAVWRAVDLKSGHECAAKVLRQRDSADLLRFVREQSVKLEHPHVVAPYGWAAEDEYVAIVMELVSGGTLEAALLDNGAVSGDVAGELLWQLLMALQYVHARGWIHRDVKPGNVLLKPTGDGRPVARLADFGIAVRDSDARLTQTGVAVGTPGYLPPEAYGPIEPTAAFDLYAAGVTAVRLMVPDVDLATPLTPEDVASLVPDTSLAGHVRGLLDADPAVRVAAAERAVEQLGADAARRAEGPLLTAHGEPFEVFDVLAPTTDRELSPVPDAARLPPGDGPPTVPVAWHVHHPSQPGQRHVVRQRAPHAGPGPELLDPFTRDETEQLGPVPGAAPVHLGDTTQVAPVESEASAPTGARNGPVDRAPAPETPEPQVAARPVTGDPPGRRLERRNRLLWALTAVALVVAAVLFGIVWWLNDGSLTPQPPPPSPAPSTSAPPSRDSPAPSSTSRPGVSVSPECSQDADGNWSCVVTEP